MWCSVIACKNSDKKKPGVTFFTFLKDEESSADTMANNESTLHVWESGGGAPWSPLGLDRTVIYKVSLGGQHCACLTVEGLLFLSGKNDRGQLGDGTCCDRPTPEMQLLKITDHFVVDVSCGFAHTAAVTDKGSVFCWGENSDHQCGPEDTPFYSEPTQVLLSPLIKAGQVACGRSHTVTISEAGELWTWGSGFQLGLGISKVAAKPRKVEFLCGRRVINVICGDCHTVALVARGQDSKNVKSEDKHIAFRSRKVLSIETRSSPKLANGITTKSLDANSQSAETGKKSMMKSDSTEGKSPLTSRTGLTDSGENDLDAECTGQDLSMQVRDNKNRLTKLKVATSVDATSVTNSHGAQLETSFTESESQQSLRSPTTPQSPGLSRSPNAFLNEAEAKEFLQKQLLADVDDPLGVMASKPDLRLIEKKDSLDMTPSSSPFSKTVENLLQHVPSSPVIVQEYVTSLTRAVVTNIRTSMMDRFNFSSSQVDLSHTANPPLATEAEAEEGEGMYPVELMLFSDKFSSGASGRMLPKSTSMGLREALKQRHHRNGSLPTSALQALCQLNNKAGPKVQLDTEVWTWGCGSAGQLGHGDLLDRCHPCQVQSLNQCRIVKVACGSCHTVALSASSQIYVWGDNALGQLGHRSATTSSPVPISVFGSLPVWDIAAGNDHTLVLCDTLTHKPRIYYCGRESPQSVVNQLTAAVKVKKVGLVHSLFAGGPFSSCLVSHLLTQHLDGAIYELASSERFFHLSLEKVYQIFIKPLRSREMIPGRVDGRPCSEILRDLFDMFESIIRLVSANHIELSLVLRGSLNLLHTQLLHDSDRCIAVFQKYFKCFNDVLAFGGFEKCVRANKEFFEKVKAEFSNVLEDSKVNASDLGSSFQHLMFLPFERPRQYQKLLNSLALLCPVYSYEEVRLQKVMQDWDRLRMSSNVNHTLADSTAVFWKTMAPKLMESLQSPSRRLVRDSRKNGLSLASAGRFSWHNFFLFNDCFVHLQNSFPTVHKLSTVWVEVLPDTKHLKNAISLVTPEETLTLTAPSHSDKAEWVWSFNQTITQALIDEKNLEIPTSTAVAPPKDRHASYVFAKPGHLKDACYTGMWRSGRIHGYGELLWSDGRRYVGQFVDGQFEGFGVYTIPKDDRAEVSEGWWKAGQLHGYGVLRYSNGDVYKGHFSEGKRHGHGCMKQGKFTASLASLYNGQWKNDKRCGYGVCDDITKGNKYMGMWLDDSRHGNGIIVTLDSLYFEGNFSYGKMTGAGLLVTDDDCFYEGEFSGGTNLCGKGTLTMPNGDYIEGQFNGSFTEGVKVNGTFHKNCEPQIDAKKASTQEIVNPKSFGKLCVPAACKWDEIFAHCYSVLGCVEGQTLDSAKVWEKVASIMSSGAGSPLVVSQSKQKVNVDELERIPSVILGQELTLEVYQSIKSYLAKAFDTNIHPLGQLMASLVDVYLATYVGVGAHMRLLFHAVQELKAYISKIYPIVRILFPLLPAAHRPMQLFAKVASNAKGETTERNGTELHIVDAYDLSSNEVEVVTPAGLLFSFLLPKVYPPLFRLYALFDAKEDERYWKRVRLWNKQSNLALMAYLGVDRKFWLSSEEKMLEFASSIFDGVQDDGYVDAIDRLQRISTSFTPTEKLSQIQMTFSDINRVVQTHIGRCYAWSMDDLFPVFQYVVIRARIQHLGAEIHFIEDLIEPHLENGQLGIMFTTLKACYFQILNEKVI